MGTSVKVGAPTGQYDGAKLLNLLNWGINRWAIKPEIGYSRRTGQWIIDAYGGVWFFTTNNAFFSTPTPLPQTEAPIGHYWFGGTTTLGKIARPDTRQSSSRLGGTLSLPINKHQRSTAKA